MDIHMHNNLHLHYRVNGNHETREDDALEFLSTEEKECIIFFEETIDSLDEGLGEEGELPSRDNILQSFPSPSNPVSHGPPAARSPSLKENDIIDLVHSSPSPSQHKETMYGSPTPDFQIMNVTPDSHFEMKARRDPLDNFSGEEGGYQPPPGSIPTPVVIANKLAEHQGGTSGVSGFLPSMVIQRRRSLDAPQSPTDQPAKQGPPTWAKPTRLPGNINLMLGNKEPTPQSIAVAAVSLQERRAQMLANLSGAAHPLDGGEPDCVRNLPTRSISFRDPTPDKSRMEALSKLGLTRDRAQSFSPEPPTGVQPESNSSGSNSPTHTRTYSSTSSNASPTISSEPEPPATLTTAKTENSFGGKTAVHSHPVRTQSKPDVGNHDRTSGGFTAPTSAEVSSRDFNSYGGKSIVVNPSASSRGDTSAYSSIPAPAKTELTENQPNIFGFKSRIMNPSAAREISPDMLRSPSQSPPDAIKDAESPTAELNSYGGKSKVFMPTSTPAPSASSATMQIVHHDSKTKEESALHEVKHFGGKTITVNPASNSIHPEPARIRIRPASLPPNTAPKPIHRGSGPSPQRVQPSPPSPEVRPNAPPKQSLRSQGITVQFSGRGTSDEARRAALKKLGLLKGSLK